MTLEDVIKPYLYLHQSEELRKRIEMDLKRHFPGDYQVRFGDDTVIIDSTDDATLTWLALMQ